jgi:hypothetical protein
MTRSPLEQMIKERTREASDYIWNQNGKHTHAALDLLIAGTLLDIATAAQKELLDTLEGEIKEVKESPYITNHSLPDKSRITLTNAVRAGYNGALQEIRALLSSHKARLQANDKEV